MSMFEIEEQDVEWTKNMLTNLTVGGVWVVPRSLLVVTKEEGSQVTIAPMPREGANIAAYEFAEAHMEKGQESGDCPKTVEINGTPVDVTFADYQALDARCLEDHSKMAGYQVTNVLSREF